MLHTSREDDKLMNIIFHDAFHQEYDSDPAAAPGRTRRGRTLFTHHVCALDNVTRSDQRRLIKPFRLAKSQVFYPWQFGSASVTRQVQLLFPQLSSLGTSP